MKTKVEIEEDKKKQFQSEIENWKKRTRRKISESDRFYCDHSRIMMLVLMIISAFIIVEYPDERLLSKSVFNVFFLTLNIDLFSFVWMKNKLGKSLEELSVIDIFNAKEYNEFKRKYDIDQRNNKTLNIIISVLFGLGFILFCCLFMKL